MSSKPRPIFVPPPPKRSPGGTTVLISSRETDGAYCVCEMTTMPGEGVPLHVHDRDEELYYILEGVLEMRAGEERFSAETGSVVVIPRDVPHAFKNRGEIPVRALMVFRPGGFDELVDELRQAREAGSLDGERRRAILSRWGVTPLDDDS